MSTITLTAPPPIVVPDAADPRESRPWWHASLLVGALFLAFAGIVATFPAPDVGTVPWWISTLALHAPFALILLFLAGGTVERLGFLRRGRTPRAPGRLPRIIPAVTVQVPLFNEHAVAARVIGVIGALRWPDDRLDVQVLDDSTDPAARYEVDRAVAELRARRPGIGVEVLRRAQRKGYKAGALEAGRRLTPAEYLAIFDADFMPTPDFLQRTIPHFYTDTAEPHEHLALVQAQWGHLNAAESALTRAQSLWVDDHHTAQMSWRAAQWRFVNFTGTAGVWRASAIERAGGWRASSLVEDCELSFRSLFAGYETTFVRNVIAPAELPSTYASYKAQQRRWTQGWAQVQRLHLPTLALRFDTTWARRLHLIYHMCIPWQWPLWALWMTLLPALIHSGLWFGELGLAVGIAVYLAPMTLWLALSTILAALATPDAYRPSVGRLTARVARIVPYIVLNTGMLPHQYSAYLEGIAGPLHAEFERTPKTAAVGGGSRASRMPRPARPGVIEFHRPYVIAEAVFAVYELGWSIVFAMTGHVWPALGALFIAACVIAIGALSSGRRG